uniref:CHCH domain-containing protein n=1 Tax=Dolomedes sulfureus TaxID=492288 RepID=A0A0P0DHN8_9ARAC|nr:hypothetical protein [Dolomedes sulfureus]
MSTTSSASPKWIQRLKRGRRPQSINKVPYKEAWPLILKHQVSTRRGQESEVPCLKETLAFITCLKDHNNSHELCFKEGQSVQKCYSNYLVQRKENAQVKNLEAFEPGKNVKDMKPEQLNKFLAHFPHKLK